MNKTLHIIGAGLAGSEAAWQAASQGVQVRLYEMRPHTKTQAHQTGGFAELVCSNSFRSDDHEHNAVGLLHHEMRQMGSLIFQSADDHALPAGGALAVDRDGFSDQITTKIRSHPLITIVEDEVISLDQFSPEKDMVIMATGPLTSESLAHEILKLTGESSLAFFDAIAPIVYKESIDFSKAWYQSRYDKAGPAGTGKDYINCPMSKEQYFHFLEELKAAPKTEFKDWEKDTPYFEGCLPIEVMAERGDETLRYGPMKPVGLTNPHAPDVKPYAIVQLRQDNALGTLYNIVGFQTKLKYQEQSRVFKLIPGLEEAEFARLGGIHRNTFIKSPILLNPNLSLKTAPHIKFAGQVTGVEGYVESSSIGMLAGHFASAEILGHDFTPPPQVTALGALLAHITLHADIESFQPMNINFGLFPELEIPEDKKRLPKGMERKKMYTDRAKEAFQGWRNKVSKRLF